MPRETARTIAGCLALLLASACTDMGDNSNASGDDGSAGEAGDDTGLGSDSTTSDDATSSGGGSMDSAPTEAASDDTGAETGVTGADATDNTTTPDSSPPESDAAEATPDATAEAGIQDAAAEAGVHDAAAEAAVHDAAGEVADATVDAALEAGVDASSDASADVGADAPADAAQDASTANGDTHCSGNVGGLCTPTEQLFQQHDQGCYDCLLQAGCLDDAPPPLSFGDSAHECSDVTGDTLVAGETRTQACLDVISCTLAHASAEPTIAFGYCGVQPTTVSCQTATPGQSGPCLLEEQTGLESTVPNTVLSRYTNTTYGGGMGNQVFQCAISNACMTCLQ